MNPLLEVRELSGFKMSTSGANANDDYFSYSEKESASLLEALLGSSLQEPMWRGHLPFAKALMIFMFDMNVIKHVMNIINTYP